MTIRDYGRLYRKRIRGTYNVNGIFRVSVRAKLALDILIPQEPHLARQAFAVRAEDASVERDWGQEGERRRFEAGG